MSTEGKEDNPSDIGLLTTFSLSLERADMAVPRLTALAEVLGDSIIDYDMPIIGISVGFCMFN